MSGVASAATSSLMSGAGELGRRGWDCRSGSVDVRGGRVGVWMCVDVWMWIVGGVKEVGVGKYACVRSCANVREHAFVHIYGS